MTNELVVLDILADDKNIIAYRPELNKITGSVTATILLQQILYWWHKNGKKKFFKFRAPCKHELYKEGDSWCEELGFTEREFDSALKRIGFKFGKTKNRIEKNKALVFYYKTGDGLTWYDINVGLLAKLINEIYYLNNKSAISILNNKSAISMLNDKSAITNNTETTTETTTENIIAQSDKNRSEPPQEEPLFQIPLVGKENGQKLVHDIYRKDIDTWQELYPGIDVESEIRKLLAWNIANPKRRKTKQGILRHINTWLSKAQDRGGGRQVKKASSLEAERAWKSVIDAIHSGDADNLDERTKSILDAMGGLGILANLTEQEANFRRRDFIELYQKGTD